MGTGYRSRNGKLLTALLCAPLFFHPPTLQADDLLSVYHQALQQAPSLRIAEAERQLSEGQRSEALSRLLPHLELDAAQANSNKETLLPAPASDSYTSNSYSLSLSQLLYDGTAASSYSAARLDSRRAEQLYQASRQGLMVEVAQAYFNLLAAQLNLQLAAAERTTMQEELKQAQKRYRLGLNTLIEVHETQAYYDLAVAAYVQAESEQDRYRELLRQYTGQAPGPLASSLQNLVLYPPQPASIEAWEGQAQEHAAELLARVTATRAAEARLRAQQKAHLPTLGLGYDYQHHDNDGGSPLQTDTQSIGIEFRLPLYAGGETSARVAQARAQLHKARAEEELTRRQVISSVRQAFLQLKRHIDRVKALRRALMSQQVALKATETGVRVGKRSNIDLLNARRAMLSANYDYNRARFDYLIANLELYRSAGTLDEEKLQMVNNWLR